MVLLKTWGMVMYADDEIAPFAYRAQGASGPLFLRSNGGGMRRSFSGPTLTSLPLGCATSSSSARLDLCGAAAAAGGAGAGGSPVSPRNGGRVVTAVSYDAGGGLLFAACLGVVAGWRLRGFDGPERESMGPWVQKV